jgi:tetratricopeptide (TPR) repeat protein
LAIISLMNQQDINKPFKDSPNPEQLEEVLALWRLPDLSDELQEQIPKESRKSYWDLSSWFRKKLVSCGCPYSGEKCQETLITWLYDLIRLNVKRGPAFDLGKVLRTSDADCLGYAKLFTTLGRQCGLDLGIAEVVTDNRGRNVPHTLTLVRLASEKKQFVDFWYGSQNIRPKRLGLRVKRAGGWNVEDIDFPEIKKAVDISYLPDQCVDAITLYIEGNHSLKKGNYGRAVEQYTQAAALYPQNARIYYNRAIGYEKVGQPEKAEVDYARALQDDSALIRTLATQPHDVVDLMLLDEKFIPQMDQQIYLLRKGYIAGRPVSPKQIALKYSLLQAELEAILSFIERILGK